MGKDIKRLYPETVIVHRDPTKRGRISEPELSVFNALADAPQPSPGQGPVYLAIYRLMEIRKLTAHIEDDLGENPREPEAL